MPLRRAGPAWNEGLPRGHKNPVVTVQVAAAIGKRVISAKSPYFPSLWESPWFLGEAGELHDGAGGLSEYVSSTDGANYSSG